MGIAYLWDTNTVIYYLRQAFPTPAEQHIDKLLKISLPAISAITEIELLCWKSADEKDISVLHGFIAEIQVIELEKPIKLRTAEIRRNHNIKLPDAIIAATALERGLILITRNSRDFKDIVGLKTLNPWELHA